MSDLLSAFMYLVDSFNLRNIITGMVALTAAIAFLKNLFDKR